MDSGSDEVYGIVKARVLVVDDQVAVREMVAMVLDRDGRFSVAAEAASGVEGLQLFRLHRPHIVVAGLALPELSGAEMLAAMREVDPAVKMVFFSGSRNRELLAAGLAALPHGFVHKTESLGTLRQALLAVSEGGSFWGPSATSLMSEIRRAELVTDGLPPRQRVVLQLIAEGRSTKQIADRLALSPKTVDNYRSRLMERLGLRDIASLTRYALRAGLVE